MKAMRIHPLKGPDKHRPESAWTTGHPISDRAVSRYVFSFKHYRMLFITAAIFAAMLQIARSQALSNPETESAPPDRTIIQSVCTTKPLNSAEAALELVCRKKQFADPKISTTQTIVVGFVGGFADPNDIKHPEVLFAAYLRKRYSSKVLAKVFSNHNRDGAMHFVMGFLDSNHDGLLSKEEKERAQIIIYGHSWGASETAALARELRAASIPVVLTIQLDIVGKFGPQPSRIPPNVESAVNFFQSEGFLKGQSKIFTLDATRTEIIGNYHLTYVGNPVNCDNYPWFARTFNKPHHEIENDPAVWEQIATLIDAKISQAH
jgi:hypothetical protein